MPEICFYEPWTYQLALPEKIEAYLKFAKRKRISYEAEDCSRYNTRTNGKSAKLDVYKRQALYYRKKSTIIETKVDDRNYCKT